MPFFRAGSAGGVCHLMRVAIYVAKWNLLRTHAKPDQNKVLKGEYIIPLENSCKEHGLKTDGELN